MDIRKAEPPLLKDGDPAFPKEQDQALPRGRSCLLTAMNHRFGDMNRFAAVNMAVILHGLNRVFCVDWRVFSRSIGLGREGRSRTVIQGWSLGALPYATAALTHNFYCMTNFVR